MAKRENPLLHQYQVSLAVRVVRMQPSRQTASCQRESGSCLLRSSSEGNIIGSQQSSSDFGQVLPSQALVLLGVTTPFSRESAGGGLVDENPTKQDMSNMNHMHSKSYQKLAQNVDLTRVYR